MADRWVLYSSVKIPMTSSFLWDPNDILLVQRSPSFCTRWECVLELTLSLRTCSMELHSSAHLWANLVQYSPWISEFLKQFPTCFNICHILFSVSFCHVYCFLSFSGLWRHPSCLRRSPIKMTRLGAVMRWEQCSAWPQCLPSGRSLPWLVLLAFQMSGSDFQMIND